jgi:hypothetical protein
MDSEERKTRAAELYLKGMTQGAIARELGCEQCTVSRDLSDIREEWKANAVRDRAVRIAEGLAKLDLLEEALWKCGMYSLVLKCIDIRFKVMGAYQTFGLVVPTAVLDWNAILDDTDPADVIERRIAQAGNSNHSPLLEVNHADWPSDEPGRS